MSVCHMEYVALFNHSNSSDVNDTEYMYDDDEEYDYSYHSKVYNISINIVRYFWPLIIIAGTVGNVLTFLVLIRRRMRRTPVYFYLAMLACADTSVLYLSGFKTWLRVITGFEVLHLSNGMCKTFMFLFLQSLHLSAFFIVALTLDRFLTLMFPFSKSVFCNLRHTKTASMIAFVFIMVYNCHVFWTIGLQTYSDGWITCSPQGMTFFICDVFPWLKLSLYTIVPFFLVLAFNSCIIFKMYQAHSQFGREGDNRTTRLRIGQYRVTVMLLGVSIAWLILTAPFALFIFIYNAGESADGTDEARFFLFKTLCFTLLYINHGINFYLYCLSGKKFRKELTEFMHSVRHWRFRSFRTRKTSTFAIKILSNREQNQLSAQKFILQCPEEKQVANV